LRRRSGTKTRHVKYPLDSDAAFVRKSRKRFALRWTLCKSLAGASHLYCERRRFFVPWAKSRRQRRIVGIIRRRRDRPNATPADRRSSSAIFTLRPNGRSVGGMIPLGIVVIVAVLVLAWLAYRFVG
jgi:hypothetical protein